MITRDNVPVRVNAVAYFRVVDPTAAIVEVADFGNATSQISQTTLRSVLGQHTLDELLSERDKINQILQQIIDEQTAPWGIKVSVVEVKDVEIPSGMQRAMARQAEAERERRAKVIAAEGEFQASAKLADAAAVIAEHPIALQLRYLQTLIEISGTNNATTVLPIPIDLLHALTLVVKPTRVALDLRRNPLTGVPVVVAPGRSARPGALGRTTRIADAATCPFCEGHEAMTPPEVLALGRTGGAPDTPGWTVRVVPNKFPAIPGQEVVVHGPEHVTAFAELPAAGGAPPLSRPGTSAAATSRGSRTGRPICSPRSTRGRPPAPRSTTPTPSSCRSPTSRPPPPPRCPRSPRRARSAPLPRGRTRAPCAARTACARLPPAGAALPTSCGSCPEQHAGSSSRPRGAGRGAARRDPAAARRAGRRAGVERGHARRPAARRRIRTTGTSRSGRG